MNVQSVTHNADRVVNQTALIQTWNRLDIRHGGDRGPNKTSIASRGAGRSGGEKSSCAAEQQSTSFHERSPDDEWSCPQRRTVFAKVTHPLTAETRTRLNRKHRLRRSPGKTDATRTTNTSLLACSHVRQNVGSSPRTAPQSHPERIPLTDFSISKYTTGAIHEELHPPLLCAAPCSPRFH
jgi:hypothetical protein